MGCDYLELKLIFFVCFECGDIWDLNYFHAEALFTNTDFYFEIHSKKKHYIKNNNWYTAFHSLDLFEKCTGENGLFKENLVLETEFIKVGLINQIYLDGCHLKITTSWKLIIDKNMYRNVNYGHLTLKIILFFPS